MLAMTVREQIRQRLLAIIEWTVMKGSLKSLDHATPKRLAEAALAALEPPLGADSLCEHCHQGEATYTWYNHGAFKFLCRRCYDDHDPRLRGDCIATTHGILHCLLPTGHSGPHCFESTLCPGEDLRDCGQPAIGSGVAVTQGDKGRNKASEPTSESIESRGFRRQK